MIKCALTHSSIPNLNGHSNSVSKWCAKSWISTRTNWFIWVCFVALRLQIPYRFSAIIMDSVCMIEFCRSSSFHFILLPIFSGSVQFGCHAFALPCDEIDVMMMMLMEKYAVHNYDDSWSNEWACCGRNYYFFYHITLFIVANGHNNDSGSSSSSDNNNTNRNLCIIKGEQRFVVNSFDLKPDFQLFCGFFACCEA